MLRRAFGETAEDDARERARLGGQFGRNGADRDARRAVGGKRIDAGRDRREGNRGEIVAGCEIERSAIAGREQRILVRSAAMPHRTDRMDDVFCREPIAARDLRRARLAAAERTAFGEQFRSGRAMDRAVDAATAEQRAVRGVHDRIDLQGRDVGDEDVAGCGAGGEGEEGRCIAIRSVYPLAPRSGEQDGEAEGRAVERGVLIAKALSPPLRGDPRPKRETGTKETLRPLRLRLCTQIDRAALADVVEMLTQEIARGLAAAAEQRLEEVVVGAELRAGGRGS